MECAGVSAGRPVAFRGQPNRHFLISENGHPDVTANSVSAVCPWLLCKHFIDDVFIIPNGFCLVYHSDARVFENRQFMY